MAASLNKELSSAGGIKVYLLISVAFEMRLAGFGLLTLKDCVIGFVPSRFLHISIL